MDIVDSKKINLIIKCPHCEDFIEIEVLNCKIFRHGVFKNNGQNIPPHSSKANCDSYITNNLIYGCGKPFKIIVDGDKYIVEICDYI